MKNGLAQLSLVVAMVLLGIFLFISGKEHKVFIENKTVGEYQALKVASYTIDDQDEEKIKKRKKKLARVKGKNHKIIVKFEKNNTEHEITKEFKLGAMDEATISIPSLIGNSKEWIKLENTNDDENS